MNLTEALLVLLAIAACIGGYVLGRIDGYWRRASVDRGRPGAQQLTDAQIMARKPICADFVSFRAGIRSIELDLGIYK